MREGFIVESKHKEKAERLNRIYEVIAKVAVKYGPKGWSYSPEQVAEFWCYDDEQPPSYFINRHIKLRTVKWYIHNRITFEDEIWNADFLHGFIRHGKINWNVVKFPSVLFYNNHAVRKLIELSPFGGNLGEKSWSAVPSLYLKFSEDSISFMAGVMAGTEIVEREGVSYAKFSENLRPIIKSWGIPIELKDETLISPIWPAIFARWMPEEIGRPLTEIKKPKPFDVEILAPVLWKLYVGTNFKAKGIPYLHGKTKVCDDFRCERGAMQQLKDLRREKKLTQLDTRIGQVIRQLAKRNKQ